jgi:hypothetical protein
MITKSKLVLIATVAAMGIATPALAQSFDPDAGTGNVLSYSYAPTRHEQVAVNRNGLHAFAMVPRGGQWNQWNAGSNAATSGYDPGIETQR